MISRAGVLQTSESLDQIGVFGRCLEDVALLTDALSGHDAADKATYARAKPKLRTGCDADAPVEPNFIWFELPFDDRLADDARAGFDELFEVLGDQVEKIVLPDSLGNIIDHHRIIHHYEMRRHLAREYQNNPDQLSAAMRGVLQKADAISDEDYAHSIEAITPAKAFFADVFNDFDAILTPSAAGEAPLGLAQTGDPVFCAMWTFCGLPSLTLPLLTGDQGLPVGVQLVAGWEDDHRLCRTAQWLLQYLDDS